MALKLEYNGLPGVGELSPDIAFVTRDLSIAAMMRMNALDSEDLLDFEKFWS